MVGRAVRLRPHDRGCIHHFASCGGTRRTTGAEPDTYGGPYGSDLRLLTGIGGIPTVQYGPGDTAVAHAPDEYVAIDDVVTCAEVSPR